MSQPTNPFNRPLPPEIYRRRRIAALVGLFVILVVLVLIVRAIAGGGGSEGPVTGAASSTGIGSSPVATGTTSGHPSTSKVTSSTAAATSAPATEEPGAQCSLDDLQLTVRAGAPTYAADQQPDFYLTLTNPTRSNCTVDTSANPMSFEVFTLTDYARVWADTDCNDPASSGNLTLQPGESRSFALEGWSRTMSAPGACTDRTAAGTGAFLLYGHIGEKTSEPATFNLA